MNWSDFSSDLLPKPVLRMVIDAQISSVTDCGTTPQGQRSNYVIGGGSFIARDPAGKEIHGEVMAGGADYFLERPDGIGVLNAMYSLKTAQGQVFNIHNRGLYVSNEQGKALEADGVWPLPEGTYQSRCTPEFTAGEGEMAWLNNCVFTGVVSYPSAENVIIHIYELVV